jgi:hypothetical protein
MLPGLRIVKEAEKIRPTASRNRRRGHVLDKRAAGDLAIKFKDRKIDAPQPKFGELDVLLQGPIFHCRSAGPVG